MAACEGPLSALDPAGPAARAAAGLWWGMFLYFTLVTAVVIALWCYAMRRPGEADNPRASRKWIIGGGLVLPLLSIAVILAAGIPAGRQMAPLPSTTEEVLRIDVTGHQWWWEVRYPHNSAEADGAITLRNELHIPVGMPVDIHLTTADVIHSFWVPRLGGKLDAIPGRTNILRLQADEAGLYRGQCAEFCGLHHAHMQFTVKAHSPEEFARWLQEATSHD